MNKIKNSIIYSNRIDDSAIDQIALMTKFYNKEKIRIMPDYHAGKGCVIGTTMILKDKVTPNLVGVDIGCGVLAVKLFNVESIDFKKLDDIIKTFVPSGFDVHNDLGKEYIRMILKDIYDINLSEGLYQRLSSLTAQVNIDKAYYSIGTLGGGNHFIEVDKDSNGDYWLLVHTGSRHLGVEVCNYWQEIAIKEIYYKEKILKASIIDNLKELHKEQAIHTILSCIGKSEIPDDLCYLTNSWNYNPLFRLKNSFKEYLKDMKICQDYAAINRKAIVAIITQKMGWDFNIICDTIHNYIETEEESFNFFDDKENRYVLRKGAVAAYKHENLVIPMNMRDGTLFCKGKGNEEWNYSAPHGAGRLMSRSKAKETLKVKDFKEDMKGVYSSTVNEFTIDEAPAAYKPMEEIVELIKPTVDILDILKPIYNFKADK